MIVYIEYLFYQAQFDHVLIQVRYLSLNIKISPHMCDNTLFHSLYGRGDGGGVLNLQYFIVFFFTLSVEGGRGKVNDAIFTLSTFFFDGFPNPIPRTF